MKRFTLVILCLLLSGCTIEMDVPDHGHTTATVVVEYEYEEVCFEDPYWEMPEWCDYYNDGSLCCVWYVGGWYEEWCKWHYDDWCWEYNGAW